MLIRLAKDNILSILGFASGLIGILLSIYFYTLTITERQPVLTIVEPRTLVADTARTTTSKIRVVRVDNKPIVGEIWAVRFYVWNPGKLAIKRQHVFEPLALSFHDKDVEKLDYSITHENRPDISRAKLKDSNSKESKGVQVDFDILENKDLIVGQILYKGLSKTPIAISGTVEGVERVLSDAPVDWSSIWPNSAYAVMKVFGLIVGIFAFMAIVATVIAFAESKFRTVLSEETRRKMSVIGNYIFGLIMVVFFLLVIFATINSISKAKIPLPSQIIEAK